MEFDIKNLLNDVSLNKNLKRKINYRKLIPHEKNFYSISEIDELADDIEDNGLLQNLVVKPTTDDNFIIIVGHRRWNAIKMLVEERNLENFASIDCIVLDKEEDDLLTELKLHSSNVRQRKYTEYEKMQSIVEMQRIYTELRDKGIEIKGKIINKISEDIGLKETQIKKYLSINKNAEDEIIDKLKNKEITVAQAYEETKNKNKSDNNVSKITTLTKKLSDTVEKNKSDLTREDIRKIKEELKLIIKLIDGK